jgi:hypothetical protein
MKKERKTHLGPNSPCLARLPFSASGPNPRYSADKWTPGVSRSRARMESLPSPCGPPMSGSSSARALVSLARGPKLPGTLSPSHAWTTSAMESARSSRGRNRIRGHRGVELPPPLTLIRRKQFTNPSQISRRAPTRNLGTVGVTARRSSRRIIRRWLALLNGLRPPIKPWRGFPLPLILLLCVPRDLWECGRGRPNRAESVHRGLVVSPAYCSSWQHRRGRLGEGSRP